MALLAEEALAAGDAERAQIWENATTLYAGIKLLLGADPKKARPDHGEET